MGFGVEGAAFASAEQVFWGASFCFGLLFRGCSGSLPAIPYAKAGPALNRRALSQSPQIMSIIIFNYFYFFLATRSSQPRRRMVPPLAFALEFHTKHTKITEERTTDGTDCTDGSEYDESGCPRIIPCPIRDIRVISGFPAC